MKLRMIEFYCLECGHTEEELVDLDAFVYPKCQFDGTQMQLVRPIEQQIHRPGNHYKHISWSVHHAGE